MDLHTLSAEITIEHRVPDGAAETQYRAVCRKNNDDTVVLTAWNTSRAYVQNLARRILSDYAQGIISDLSEVKTEAPAAAGSTGTFAGIRLADVSCQKDSCLWLTGRPDHISAALAGYFDDFAEADQTPANERATTNDWVYRADKGKSILCRRTLEHAVNALSGPDETSFRLADLYRLLTDRKTAEAQFAGNGEDSPAGRFFLHEYFTDDSPVHQAASYLREDLRQLLEKTQTEQPV